MRTASKIILLVEAIIVAYFTFLGLLLSFGAMIPFVFGQPGQRSLMELLAGVIIITALISGWRIFLWVIVDGPRKGRKICLFWWVFAVLGAVLLIMSLILSFRVMFGIVIEPPDFAFLFPLGIYFLIPFTHLIIEIVWQSRANKSLLVSS